MDNSLSREFPDSALNLGHLPEADLEVLLLVLEHEAPLSIELGKNIVELTVELQDVGVVLPQAAAVADCHERDAQRLCRVVHDLHNHKQDTQRALVEDGVARLVVEQAR